MEEVWRAVEGFVQSHEVSNLGRVRSLPREYYGVTPTGGPARRSMVGCILKQRVSNTGYLRVGIALDGKVAWRSAHRLVAVAFVPQPKGREQVNHIDGDKTNNRADNLEWSDAQHNQLHAISNGLARGRRGSEHGMTKLTEDDVREIRQLLATGMVQRRIAERFGVANCKITMIKQGTAWKHVA